MYSVTLLDLVKEINSKNFAEKIDLDYIKPYVDSFKKNVGNSALRKIYDAYLDITEKKDEDYEIEKQIWIAKIAYQEKRRLLPNGFAKSLKIAEENLWKDLFKKFLEVLVAYHKYLWGKE